MPEDVRMASVRAETCSVHVRVTKLIKINLFCFRLNKCGLSKNESNRAASIKIYLTCIALFVYQNLGLR